MRSVLALGLFALAASSDVGAQVPKKAAPPKLNFKKIAAAEAALTKAGCQLVREKDKKDEFFGQVRVVNFPVTAVDADLTKMWQSLADLPALNAVDVGGCTKITDTGVFELARLQNLEALYLDRTGVTDKGLEFLAGAKKLFWLDLNSTAVTDRGMKSVGMIAGLEHLSLRHVQVGDEGLSHLADLQWMRDLSLPNRVTEDGLKHIANMRMMTNLDLGFVRVGDKGAAVIGGFPRLESLNIRSGLLTDAGLKPLLNCTSLHTLQLDGNAKVTAEQVGGFDQMKKLEYLSLSRCGVNDEGLKAIVKAPNLTRLELDGTKITAAGVPELANQKKLVFLDLNNTPADATGLRALEKVKTLRDVHAVETKVTQTAANRFMQVIPGSKVWLQYPPPPKAVAGVVVRDPGKPNRAPMAGGSPRP